MHVVAALQQPICIAVKVTEVVLVAEGPPGDFGPRRLLSCKGKFSIGQRPVDCPKRNVLILAHSETSDDRFQFGRQPPS